MSLVRALRSLGVSSLVGRVLGLSVLSFIAGLSQAGLLVVLSQLALSSARSSGKLSLKGVSLSVDQAVLASAVLLVLFCSAALAAAATTSSISRTVLETGRRPMVDGFFGANWAVQSDERLGNVQQLITVNCDNLAGVVVSLATGLQSLLSVVALLGAAFVVNPLAAAGTFVLGVALFSLLRPINTWSRRAAASLAADMRTMGTLVTEYTRLARDFRMFGVQHRATEVLDQRNRRAAQSYGRNRRIGLFVPVVYQTFALAFIIIGLTAISRQNGNTLGATGAVLLLILRSLTYGSSIQSTSQQLRSYDAFLDGLQTELARFSAAQPFEATLPWPTNFGVTFDNVSFTYDDKTNALANLSFSVREGTILGIVGRSGSGKTTLSQLLLGLRNASIGQVLIGDVPSALIARDDGSSPVALVAQEPILFQGSIASNISFLRDVSFGEIQEAARAAHLHDDVMMMPEAYDTQVGEGGAALSGGQRQRLAIARALVGHPRLLVLDEPTSALDGRSERLVRQTLTDLKGKVTVVVISHRLATIEDCDVILVLEKGAMADFGPFSLVTEREAFHQVSQEHMSERPPLRH
jgi:ATP-binding cassette subfamily B protein